MLVLIFSLLLGGVTCQLGISHQRARWLDILRARSPSHQGTFDPAKLYPAHNLSIPIDHFLNESRYELHDNGTFDLRYWFDASYYQTGGPVYLFEAGEANAEPRLPILQMGIMAKLARETGGLGVILEHRYYGTSQPFANLSTENLRFLTTAQALADTAYFAQNIIFPGMEHVNREFQSWFPVPRIMKLAHLTSHVIHHTMDCLWRVLLGGLRSVPSETLP